ncbi:MAG: A/G-specific adenine glycosylase [Propionicimonas sp.]
MSVAPTSVPDLATPLIAWYAEFARDLPWRRPDFGAWGVLVSEFMLQQTPVNRVIPHLEAWLERWPTPAALASEPLAEAVRQWANLGYPRRALWLHRVAVEITERHGGLVPSDVPTLLALSGVGDYTARAVAVFAHGERHPVVDINTRRVLARVLAGRAQPGSPARRDLAVMTSILPGGRPEAAIVNAATMELGATVCTSRAPRCTKCPLAGLCAWRAAGYPDTGDVRRKQAAYAGSDRQARGAVLKVLREVAPESVAVADVIPGWPDAMQRERAIGSVVADGLAEVLSGRLQLPS